MIGVSDSRALLLSVAVLAATVTAGCVWDDVLSLAPDVGNALINFDADLFGGPLKASSNPGFTYDQLYKFESILQRQKEVEIDWIKQSLTPWRIGERSISELLQMQALLQISSRITPDYTDVFDPLTDETSEEIVSEELVKAAGEGDFFECYSILRQLVVLGSTKTWRAIIESHSDRIVTHVLDLSFYGAQATCSFVRRALPDADDALTMKLILRALDGVFVQRLANIITSFDPQSIARCVDQLFQTECAEMSDHQQQKRFLILALACRRAEYGQYDHQNHDLLDGLFQRHLSTGRCSLAVILLARDLGSKRITRLVDYVSNERERRNLLPLNPQLIEAMAAARKVLWPTPSFIQLGDTSWLRNYIQKMVLSLETNGLDRIVSAVPINVISSIFNDMLKKMSKEQTLSENAPKWIRAIADFGPHMSSLALSKDLWEVIDSVTEEDDVTMAALHEAAAVAYSRAEFDSHRTLPAFFGSNSAASIYTFNSYAVLERVTETFWRASLAAMARMSHTELNTPDSTMDQTALEMLINLLFEEHIQPEHRDLYVANVEQVNLHMFADMSERIEFVDNNFLPLFVDGDLQPRLLLAGLSTEAKKDFLSRMIEIMSPQYLSAMNSDQLAAIGQGLHSMISESPDLLVFLVRGLSEATWKSKDVDQLTVAGTIACLAGRALGQEEAALLLSLVNIQMGLDLEPYDVVAFTDEFYGGFSQEALQSTLKLLILGEPEWRDEAQQVRDNLTPESLAGCLADFANLSPVLWAEIFAPALLNAMRAEDVTDLHQVLTYWLPQAQPQRNHCLAEVILAAAAPGPDLLFEMMTDADSVFLLDYLRGKPDEVLESHDTLLLRTLRFVLDHKFSLRANLFYGHDLDLFRQRGRSVIWALLARVLESHSDLHEGLVSVFATSPNEQIESEKLKLLTEVVSLKDSVKVFNAVLALVSKLPPSALNRDVASGQNILTWLLRRGTPNAEIYRNIRPIVRKMSPEALGGVVLVLAERAVPFVNDPKGWDSFPKFFHDNVPLELQYSLRLAALNTSKSELGRVTRYLHHQCNRKRKRIVAIDWKLVDVVIEHAGGSFVEVSSATRSSKKARIM